MKLFLILFILTIGTVPIYAGAQGAGTRPDATITLFNPLGCSSVAGGPPCFVQILQGIIARLFDIIYPILAAMVFYGGIQMMFARGSSEKFNAGKKTITYAVIGFTVIVVSQGLAAIIYSLLSV